MSSSAGKPGKTAPRLIQDLYYYDPRKAVNGNRNVLCEAPPPLGNDGYHEELAIPQGSCHHEYMIKYEQSKLLSAGTTEKDSYKIASLCNKCRWHMDIYVDLTNTTLGFQPCPTKDYPLHHLVLEDQAVLSDGGSNNQSYESRFVCTAHPCCVPIRIRLRPPRLGMDVMRRLAGAESLKARNAAARENEPDRDHVPLKTIEVMDILSKYVKDSLVPTTEPRRVNARNRKFMNAFGKDCNDILLYLGFTNDIIEEGEVSEEYWFLPRPPAPDDSLEGDPHRRLLEDVRTELLTLISHRPEDQKKSLKNFMYAPMPSVTEIEKLFGSLEYEKSPASRRAVNSVTTSEMEHPAYSVLGILGNFSDDLVFFAYKQQTKADPMNSALYYECLRIITNERNSETLHQELGVLASLGQVDRNEMNMAYNYFSIDPRHHLAISDQVILGKFESRLQSSGEWQANEIRHRLSQLGAARGSELLKQVAARTIETYDQAMSWFGADKDTADDYIISLYKVKLQDNSQDSSHRESCQKALEIIAETRKSEMLKTYLKVGDIDSDTVVEDAYRLLGINDRSSALDPQVLRALVDSYIMDQPEKGTQFEQAYEILLSRAPMNDGFAQGDPAAESVQYAPEEWPVGLANIGNTCYLNSLLQFYFSIKPIREMILDIDKYKMEITEENLKAKRVGGRLVDKAEVTRAQEFTHELHKLFTGMVTEKGHVVRPEIKLAALTLPEVRKQDGPASPINARPPGAGLGHINGVPVAGPMLPPMIQISTVEETSLPPPAADSPASDSTLVGEFTPESETHEMEGVVHDVQAAEQTEPGDEAASGSATNPVDLTEERPASFPEPPKKPPPIPPRPPKDASDLSREIANLEFRAEQKDVTDAMDNVLDQIERSIQGNGVDKGGEQLDIIKQLFYYSYFRTVWKLTESAKRTNTALEKDWNIKVPMADYPRDLYSCLDDVFDREPYQLNNEPFRRYATMTEPPPILQILFQRVQFKRQEGHSVKNNQHVKFDEVLFMDRYLHAPDTDLLERREHSWNMKRRLKSLEERKARLTDIINEMDAPVAVEAAADFLTGHKFVQDEDIIDILHEKARKLREELAVIETNITKLKEEIDGLFRHMKQVEYHLYSVIFQRGGASGGHYWCFIKDFKFDLWRKYNDRVVSLVENPNEIFEQKSNDMTSTPYFLVYVRAGLEDDLTDAVYRRIEPDEPPPQPEPQEAPEVEMKEIETSNGEATTQPMVL